MPARRQVLAALLLSLAAVGQQATAKQPQSRRYLAASDRPYEDVLADTRFAITEHNFRITGGNHIGSAIQQRIDRPFPQSDIIHFCNLEFARQFIEAAADFVRHMPCKVVVYQHHGRVVVETELLDETDPRVREPAQRVNTILRAIVDYATEDY